MGAAEEGGASTLGGLNTTVQLEDLAVGTQFPETPGSSRQGWGI